MGGSLIDLRRLRYFRAIARNGSFSEAARSLNITQPALTHHMNQLEESLGVRIFDRLPRGVSVTVAGAALLRRADRILDEVGKAEDEMRALALSPSAVARIRLAVTPAVAASLTPAILSTAERHPDYALVIIESRSKDADQLLLEGRADLAVVVLDANLPPRAIALDTDTLVYVSASPPQTDVTEMPCRELAEYRLVLPSSRRTLRPRLDRVMAELGIHLNVIAEIDGIDLRKQAVLSGLGDTITSYLNVARDCRNGQLHGRLIVEPKLERQIALLYRDGFPDEMLGRIAGLLQSLLAATRFPG